MTPSIETDGSPRGRGAGLGGRPWARVAFVIVVLGLAFLVSRGCQQSQVRITKEQAIATAEDEVSFDPTRTQVRLLRQGLDSQPFWVVSLSIPTDQASRFRRLAVVRIDANTGEVADVRQPRPARAP